MLQKIKNFFLSQKPVVLDIYVVDSNLATHTPIQRASKFFPDWWKNIDSNAESPTMRHCAGFVDLFKSSFVVPMWADAELTVEQEGTDGIGWQFYDFSTDIKVHPNEQRGSYLDNEKWQHAKITNPIFIHCTEEINFLFHDACWNRENFDDYIIPSGILEFKYNHSLNINMMLKRKEDKYTLFLNHKQPLVYLTPITDRKVKINYHIVTPEEFVTKKPKLAHTKTKKMQTAKELAKQSKSKCPFH